MATTEQARKDIDKTTDELVKHDLQEIIKAAAVYERLEANSDFSTVLDHMRGLVKLHDEQISGYVGQLPGTSFFKRARIMEVILIHQIRKEQLEEAINYPKRIVFEAKEAREHLDAIREKENHHGD